MPIKQRIANLDFLSMIYLLLGFLVTGLIATLIAYVYSVSTAMIIVAVYFTTLICLLWRNAQLTG